MEVEVMAPPKPLRRRSLGVVALSGLASLKLTVVLFVLSLILVFCGTLAQIDKGIWVVVHDYFRSAFLWIPLYIFFPRTMKSGWLLSHVFIPYPGGWTIGTALLINVVAAHLVRFKLSWKRSGIILTHAGLIVLMLGELVTGMFAVENKMSIPTGLASNFVENTEAVELAILSPVDDKTDDVTVIPAARLRKGGVVQDAALPFNVEIRQYMPNSTEPRKADGKVENPTDRGDGRFYTTSEKTEGTGVSSEQMEDMASAYITLKDKESGKSLGTYLVSTWLYRLSTHPYQQVAVGDKVYDVALRYKREYKAYSVTLHKFTHENYPGTDTPKDFASTITLDDPSRTETRDTTIRMNEPLRYHGETFYQLSVLPADSGTVLQVVRNPGWAMPYLSCVMVGVGMAVHFGISLVGFLRKRAAL
jgi:hypothetical protein